MYRGVFLSNIPVSRKIWGAILILLAAMLVVAALAMWQAFAAQQRADAAMVRQDEMVMRVVDWQGIVQTQMAKVTSSESSGDPSVADLFALDKTKDGSTLAAARAAVQERLDNDASRALWSQAEAAAQAVKGVVAVVQKAHEDAGAVDRPKVEGELYPAVKKYLAAVDQVVAAQRDEAARLHTLADTASQGAIAFGIGGALVVLVVGMFVASTLVRTIRQPLRESVALAEAIAQGDLTQRMDATRGDEFGELMRSLQNMNAFLER
ncbi:HAMP domain-containing protein, partial [Ramlibacter sp. H39-3-26]|uniref:HAMP domain-containing protein n=1 Tax=Curvibacter soli TaxID=3031331 RepID=UPI0023DAA5C7